jgi:hypothetical protein
LEKKNQFWEEFGDSFFRASCCLKNKTYPPPRTHTLVLVYKITKRCSDNSFLKTKLSSETERPSLCSCLARTLRATPELKFFLDSVLCQGPILRLLNLQLRRQRL